jgi:hypothetical protein
MVKWLNELNEAAPGCAYLTYLTQLTYLTVPRGVPISSDCPKRRRLSEVEHGPNPF